MSRALQWFRVAAFLPLLSVPGCATIDTRVDPFAKDAGRRGATRVYVYGDVDGLTIYDEGGRKYGLWLVNDPTFGEALGNSTRESVARGAGAATYTNKQRYSPAIFVDREETLKFRLVRRDGSSVVVTREGKLGKRYFVIDWLLVAPTFFVSLGVDWATKNWRVYDPIDVDQEFQRAAAAARKTTQ